MNAALRSPNEFVGGILLRAPGWQGYCYAHQEDVYMSLRQMTDYDLNERNRVTCFCVIFRRCIGD